MVLQSKQESLVYTDYKTKNLSPITVERKMNRKDIQFHREQYHSSMYTSIERKEAVTPSFQKS